MKAADLGLFMAVTGSTPEVYRRLTRVEREEFSRAAIKVHPGKRI